MPTVRHSPFAIPGAPPPTLFVAALAPEASQVSQYLRPQDDLLVTGMGQVNAAMALAVYLERHGRKWQHVLNVGSCGALFPLERELYQVVEVFQRDSDVCDLEEHLGLRGNNKTIRKYTMEDSALSDLPRVVCASGDSFVSDDAQREALSDLADVVDMELYAYTRVASFFGLTISAVKYVTDVPGEKVEDWTLELDNAASAIGYLAKTYVSQATTANVSG